MCCTLVLVSCESCAYCLHGAFRYELLLMVSCFLFRMVRGTSNSNRGRGGDGHEDDELNVLLRHLWCN